MVVGSGLIAQAFSKFKENESVLIFASGVANSKEQHHSAYKREIDLLKSHLSTPKYFIYFSTISVYDKSIADSEYILHKRRVEGMIKEGSTTFTIFRLPILVGHTPNQHTLMNYLFRKISNGERLEVHLNACRYLMDIDDVSMIISRMITSGLYQNQILDINFNNPIQIPDLVNKFENYLGVKAKVQLVKKGDCYQSQNETFIHFVNELKYKLPEDYVMKVIEKYFPAVK